MDAKIPEQPIHCTSVLRGRNVFNVSVVKLWVNAAKNTNVAKELNFPFLNWKNILLTAPYTFQIDALL